jgi:hypothetical protein
MFGNMAWSLLFCFGAVACAPGSIPSHTYGPLWHSEQDTNHTRLDALGPFLTVQDDKPKNTEEFGFRPFFYRVYDRDTGLLEWDALYPLMTVDSIGDESRFQFIQLFSWSTTGREQTTPDERFTLFPFIFISDAERAEKSYWAVFPLYGEIKHRLRFDRIFFVAFPAYLDTKKKDLRTRYALFPLVSWSEGKDIEGWKVFPFYGWQTKKGAYDKRYILFPFWISADLFWDPENERHARASLPFFYHEWTPTFDARTVLWPFFRRVEDRKREYVEWDFPWPLWVIARGKDYNITRFLPFYGKSQDRDRRGYAFLYPLWKWNVADQPGGKVETSRFLIYLLADTEKSLEGRTARRVDSLPLFQYKRDYDGSVSFQTLALLEPLLPGQKSIIRNYSPLWTIFEHKRAPNGDARNVFLWNLWRWEKQGDKRQNSALLGLFQFSSEGEKRSLRLLYLPKIEWK